MAGDKASKGWTLLLFSFHFAQAAALEQGHGVETACMAVPFSLLQENDFNWSLSTGNQALAFRTVYKSTASWNAREALIFDIYHDTPVRTFVRDLKSAIHAGMTKHQLAKICMTKVQSALGAQSLGAETEMEEPLHSKGVVARIGDYIHSGQGVCRHHAFLLLIALEAVGMRGATLHRGWVRTGKEQSRHAWVVWNKYTLDSMWNKDWVKTSLYKKGTKKRRIEFDANSVELGRCGPVWTGKHNIGNDTIDYLLRENEYLRRELEIMNITLDVNSGWTFSSFFLYWLAALGIAVVVHLYFMVNEPQNEPGVEVEESDDEGDDSDDESEEAKQNEANDEVEGPDNESEEAKQNEANDEVEGPDNESEETVQYEANDEVYSLIDYDFGSANPPFKLKRWTFGTVLSSQPDTNKVKVQFDIVTQHKARVVSVALNEIKKVVGARVCSLIDHVPDTPFKAWVLEGDIGDVIGPGSERTRLMVRFTHGEVNILKSQIKMITQ